MRLLGRRASAALVGNSLDFFVLAKLGLSYDYCFTSLPFDVRFNSLLFRADRGLVSLSSPKASSTVDREIYDISFLDHSDELQIEIRNGVNGSSLVVYVGFFDSQKNPILARSDVLVAYEGVIDSAIMSGTSESKIVKFQAASPMANLDLLGGIIVSQDGMDQINTSDTSFDDVYQGGKATTFKWGKS